MAYYLFLIDIYVSLEKDTIISFFAHRVYIYQKHTGIKAFFIIMEVEILIQSAS